MLLPVLYKVANHELSRVFKETANVKQGKKKHCDVQNVEIFTFFKAVWYKNLRFSWKKH